MTQAEIAGTITIAEYMGYKHEPNPLMRPVDWFRVDRITLRPIDRFKYHSSLDALAPVVKKVRDELECMYKDEEEYYRNLPISSQIAREAVRLDRIENRIQSINRALNIFTPSAVFDSVVAAINFINDKMKDICH